MRVSSRAYWGPSGSNSRLALGSKSEKKKKKKLFSHARRYEFHVIFEHFHFFVLVYYNNNSCTHNRPILLRLVIGHEGLHFFFRTILEISAAKLPRGDGRRIFFFFSITRLMYHTRPENETNTTR